MTGRAASYGGEGIRFRHPAVPGLVSVVMPCFNAARFLPAAIASVLRQTHRAVELIVVDDGSTDGSGSVARAQRDAHPSRIHLLTQANAGPSSARNRGLAEVRGEFVAFLDADDYWSPRCLARLVEGAQRAAAPVAYCGWQNVGDGGPGTHPYIPPDYAAEDAAAAFLRGCPWPIHAAVVRRDLVEEVGGFSERYHASSDYDLWLRILGLGQRFVLVPKVLAFYRWHGDGQISADCVRQELDAWHVRRDFVRHCAALVRHLPRSRLRELTHGALRSAASQAARRLDVSTAQALYRHMVRHGAAGRRDLRLALPALLPRAAFARLLHLLDRAWA